MIDPELELEPIERSDLAMTYHSKGWPVVVKLLRVFVEEARVDLDNADHSKPSEVMAKHALSRTTGVVVTKLLTRIASEVALQHDLNDKEPKESAPGVDLDDVASATSHMPNLLGDVTYIEEGDGEEESQ